MCFCTKDNSRKDKTLNIEIEKKDLCNKNKDKEEVNLIAKGANKNSLSMHLSSNKVNNKYHEDLNNSITNTHNLITGATGGVPQTTLPTTNGNQPIKKVLSEGGVGQTIDIDKVVRDIIILNQNKKEESESDDEEE